MRPIATETVMTRPRRRKLRTPTNLSDLLLSLRERTSDVAQLETMFLDALYEGAEHLVAEAGRFWFSLNRRRLLDPPRPPTPRLTPEQKAERLAALHSHVMLKLTLEMPIGSARFGDLTKEQVESLGPQFAQVTAAMKPGEKVRDAWTDESLAKFHASQQA